ncbi:MAG TPA: hypothetical protein VNS88_09095 [Nitrospiraceae bacterium]|nr:hypothetical protein [Nitrospiraceae bacterium]
MARQGRVKGFPYCPGCGKVLDAYTGMGNKDVMGPGDLTVCAYCSAPLEWDGENYHPLTGSALVLARLNPNFLAAEELARHSREHYRAKKK